MSFNQIQYRTGEFVYVEPKDKGVERHIVNIGTDAETAGC